MRGSALTLTSPTLDHLIRLTDEVGLFEHARGSEPRREHGYCVDDVGRALLVCVREPETTLIVSALTELYLQFLVSAIAPDGRSHNRRSADGAWTDEPGDGDWWGRAAWGLGVAASRAPSALTRTRARLAVLQLAVARSPHPRAMTFAALGAGELVLAGERDPALLALLRDGLAVIPDASPGWGWPEPRLRYGNASVAEALILGGAALNDAALTARGLAVLDALLRLETRDGHLSVTGTAGRAPGDTGAQFDQQPIEVAAIADAAARAFDVTSNPRWLEPVRLAWAWFLGDNDSGVPMVHLASGAGFDGLERDGRNDNRGAESTLAALSTHQQARRLGQA